MKRRFHLTAFLPREEAEREGEERERERGGLSIFFSFLFFFGWTLILGKRGERTLKPENNDTLIEGLILN